MSSHGAVGRLSSMYLVHEEGRGREEMKGGREKEKRKKEKEGKEKRKGESKGEERKKSKFAR